MLLVKAHDICRPKRVDTGIRYIPTHTSIPQVKKLNKHRYTKALHTTMRLKFQQQQAKCKLFNILQSPNNVKTTYYQVYSDYHHSVYMLSILPGKVTYSMDTIFLEHFSQVNISPSFFAKFSQVVDITTIPTISEIETIPIVPNICEVETLNTTTESMVTIGPDSKIESVSDGIDSKPIILDNVDDRNTVVMSTSNAVEFGTSIQGSTDQITNLPFTDVNNIIDRIDCNNWQEVNVNLDLDNPTKHGIKLNNNDAPVYHEQTFSIIFYCNRKGKVVRPALYFQENIDNFRDKWTTAQLYGSAAARNVTNIDFCRYDLEHFFWNCPNYTKYQVWNCPNYTNDLFNSEEMLFKYFFTQSPADQIVKVKIDDPVEFKHHYGDRVQIYQYGQGQSTMNYAAVDVDNSSAELKKDTSLSYQDDHVKFNILPTGEVAMLTSNSPDDKFSMIGYKYAQSVKNPKQKVIIKLGIYKNSKIATTCNSNAKIRTNHCKVLKINKIHVVDNNWMYGHKIRRAQSCVYNPTNDFIYTVGEDITITDFDPDLKEVCRPGIHYFTSPEFALRNYSNYKEFKYLIENPKTFKLKSKTTDQITTSSTYDQFKKDQD